MKREMPSYKIKYGSEEWYLYHHYKNEEPIIPLIILSCFFLICRGGDLLLLITWGWYFSWASKNNRELDNDPDVLYHRESWKKLNEKYKW